MGFWSLLASVLGGLLSVLFAFNAANRAGGAKKAAEQASKDARRTMILSQIQDDLTSIVLSLNLLEENVSRGDWNLCVRLSREVFLRATKASEKPEGLINEEEKNVLNKVVTQAERMTGTFREAFKVDKLADTATVEASITSLTGACVRLTEAVKGKSHAE